MQYTLYKVHLAEAPTTEHRGGKYIKCRLVGSVG